MPARKGKQAMNDQRCEELLGELAGDEEELLSAFRLMPDDEKQRLLRVAQHLAKHSGQLTKDQIRDLFNSGIQ